MESVSDKGCRETRNTHLMFSDFFFFLKSCCLCIMWKNIVERGRPQMKIWCMRIAFWILKATNTHSEYTISNAFPLQQCMHERACVTSYVLCLSCFNILWLFSLNRCNLDIMMTEEQSWKSGTSGIKTYIVKYAGVSYTFPLFLFHFLPSLRNHVPWLCCTRFPNHTRDLI